MRIFPDIDYFGDGGLGGFHELTIYSPDARPSIGRPVAIGFHGGGWAAGDDGVFRDGANQYTGGPMQIVHRLNHEGIIAVTVRYRLTLQNGTISGYAWPDMGDDFAKAYKWVVDNIADYGGDPTNIVLIGGSAGGHLVTRLYDDGIVDYSDCKGIVSWSGAVHKIEDYFNAGTYPFGGDIHAVEQYLFADQEMAHTLHDDSEGFYTLMLTASSPATVYAGHPKVHMMGSLDEGTGAVPSGFPIGIPITAISAYHAALNSLGGSAWCSTFPAPGSIVAGHWEGGGSGSNIEHTIDVFPGYVHGYYGDANPSTLIRGIDQTLLYVKADLGI